MEKKHVLLGLLALALVMGCSRKESHSPEQSSKKAQSSNTFIVKVSGTDGAKFDGDYIVATTDGQSVSYASIIVDGTIPTEYSVEANYGVQTRFVKRTHPAVLRVEIEKDGKVVGQGQTAEENSLLIVHSYGEKVR